MAIYAFINKQFLLDLISHDRNNWPIADNSINPYAIYKEVNFDQSLKDMVRSYQSHLCCHCASSWSNWSDWWKYDQIQEQSISIPI